MNELLDHSSSLQIDGNAAQLISSPGLITAAKIDLKMRPKSSNIFLIRNDRNAQRHFTEHRNPSPYIRTLGVPSGYNSISTTLWNNLGIIRAVTIYRRSSHPFPVLFVTILRKPMHNQPLPVSMCCWSCISICVLQKVRIQVKPKVVKRRRCVGNLPILENELRCFS